MFFIWISTTVDVGVGAVVASWRMKKVNLRYLAVFDRCAIVISVGVVKVKLYFAC